MKVMIGWIESLATFLEVEERPSSNEKVEMVAYWTGSAWNCWFAW
jgi:hypothetical protein